MMEISLPTGLKVNAATVMNVDWASIRTLVESGVPYDEAARHFKIEPQTVKQRASTERWMTPHRVESIKREIVRVQSEAFKRSGKAKDINQVKAEIWKERGEIMKEKAFEITKKALDGLSEESAATLIDDAKSFKAIVEVARKLSGEEAEESKAPQLAVNIGLLRSQMPVDDDVIDI